MKKLTLILFSLIAWRARALDVSMVVIPARPPVIDGDATFFKGTPHERTVVGPWFHPLLDILSDDSVSLTRLKMKVTSKEGETVTFDIPLSGVSVGAGEKLKFNDIFNDRLPKSSSYEYIVDVNLYGFSNNSTYDPFEREFSFSTQ